MRDDLEIAGPEIAYWQVLPYLAGNLQAYPELTTLQEITVTENETAIAKAPETLRLDDGFSVNVAENSPGGTLVGTLSASDPDDDASSLHYELLDDAGGRWPVPDFGRSDFSLGRCRSGL